jgi:hypothetical protein
MHVSAGCRGLRPAILHRGAVKLEKDARLETSRQLSAGRKWAAGNEVGGRMSTNNTRGIHIVGWMTTHNTR